MWTAVTLTPRHKLTTESIEIAIHPRFGTLNFRSGQFVVLEVQLEQGVRRSAFSIVRSERNGIIIGVKKNGDHGISAWLNNLQKPTKASLAGPFGQFQITPSAKKHIFITGGSGITPVRSMLDDLLGQEVESILIYANQSPEQAMYLQSFRLLAQSNGITLIEVYDRNIFAALQQVDCTGAAFYTCGPTGLIINALSAIQAHGIPEDGSKQNCMGWIWTPRGNHRARLPGKAFGAVPKPSRWMDRKACLTAPSRAVSCFPMHAASECAEPALQD